MRFFINFSFKGTNYHGWQSQPNANSIQDEMERVMSILLNEQIKLIASGRTDSGVHAYKMIAHFDAKFHSNPNGDFVYKLNQFLPEDISVNSIRRVKDDAHARFDALSRTYEYFINTKKTPFGNEFHYNFDQSLDIKAMKEATKLLIQYDDFECFSKSRTDVKTFICNISFADWTLIDNGYKFTITANRFLRNMVRAIVGTIIDIGLKKKFLDDLTKIIESKDRSLAGFSVPAKGLFLTEIQYPKNIYL